MGDAQSAQRAGKKDAAAAEEEEESGKVNDVQTEQNIEDKPLNSKEQISEINGKADGSVAALNGHCEDEVSAEDKNVAETKQLLKEEETPLENVEANEKSPDKVDTSEVEPAEIIEMEVKQNDINESFRKFFSNIGLKLTVKKGSSENVETETDVPEEGPNIPEDFKDNAQKIKSETDEQNVELSAAQEANDNDSTTCPTLTDGTSENLPENIETKTTEIAEEVVADNADAGTTSPAISEETPQNATPEEETHPALLSTTDEKVVDSPLKRFFTTGIFSSLRRKKKLIEDEAKEKELVDIGKKETGEIAEQAAQEQQQDKKEITLDADAATTEKELGETEILAVASTQAKDKIKSIDASTGIVNEPEILNSQEKVEASPLKRLMSGSSLKKLSKKPKGKKSGDDAKMSGSREQISDQLLSSTESAENQKEESPAQPSAAAVAEEEDSAWAAFKKLVTPKKRIKKSSLSNEEAQILGSVDETKPNEGEQISDSSTEEGKKRKDSSVSWEAVLCGSGRRRSRKTSDSEDETPQIDTGDSKQDGGLKQGEESPLERSNEVQESLTSAHKQEGSPPEGEGESTWKSFKKLVTPKTKGKDESEGKDTLPSDSEITQDDSTFSIKKLLPGRKKRKPAEKQDQISSDEADKEVASGDEDSETPAVVPLSEFDIDESGVHIQTKADIESYTPEEEDNELKQDLLNQKAEPILPCGDSQIETQKVPDNEEALQNEASTTPATIEEPDEFTELISKHQQLSDIPEEGVLTETMATPASATEEPAIDDTIAEDLIEITSEAITAPEPVDVTLADETEMISAVSQLSESSKTSGNTTPVPAEYNVKDTELLLEQVVENISLSPHTVPVSSEEPSSERIVSSSLPQTLENFKKEQPKILEIHKGSALTMVHTELNAELIDTISELAATAQTESVPDVNKTISTEIVSEVHKEELDNAVVTVDEVYEASIIQLQETFKELEITDSQCESEYVSEEKEELPPKTLPEDKEDAPDEGSVVVAGQAEDGTSKTETKEQSAPPVVDETDDGDIEWEVQTLTEKGDQRIQNIPEQTEVEDQQSVVVDELEALTNAGKDVIASDEDSVQSLEKEAASLEDILPAETVTEQTEHLTEVSIKPENTELQTEASKTDSSELTDVLEVAQKATLDSEVDSVESPEKEVPSSEDIPPAEESIDGSKQRADQITEVTDEKETQELQSEVPKVSEVVQATKLESEEDSVQKEIQSLEDIQSAERVTGKSKQTPEHLTEVIDETESKEPQAEVPKETKVVQAVTLDSEEGSVPALKKEVISEDVQPEEKNEPKETETAAITEDNVEAVDDSKTEDVPEPKVLQVVQTTTFNSEAGSPQLIEKEVISEVETVTDEPKQETIELYKEQPVEQEVSLPDVKGTVPETDAEASVKDEPKQETIELYKEQPVEQEVSLPDVKGTVPETDAEASKSANAQSIEEINTQNLEMETLLDIPKPEPDSVIETKVVAQVDQDLEMNKDQKTESIPQDVQAEDEDRITEAVEELQTVTAAHVPSVAKEASREILEDTVFSEEVPAPCVDRAEVSQEPKYEEHISTVQSSDEGEKVGELKGAEKNTVAAEHAVVMQVITCHLKDVSAVIPDVLIEETHESQEPLIERRASETEVQDTVETTTPIMKDNVNKTADAVSEVVVLHVPSVEFDSNHRIQVQVVDVDIKSAENIVDTVIEIGVTEVKEAVNVCHETLEKIENLLATPAIEDEVNNEENNVTIQEVIQHVKEKLPETILESVVDNLEQEVIKQPDAVIEVSEMVQSGSTELQDQKRMKDSTGLLGPAVISDNIAIPTEHKASEDQLQTSDVSLDVSHDRQENLEEIKAELQKSEDATAPSGEFDKKEVDKNTTEAQSLQSIQKQIVAPSNMGLAVPQNTGTISSIGNVESPSSLSLEFKLNIQFGQAKVSASTPSPKERVELVKQHDVSEAAAQAVEPVEPTNLINPTERVESKKQKELTEIAVQATEITEPEVILNSAEGTVISNQSILKDTAIQEKETTEPVQQLQSKESIVPNIPAEGKTEAGKQITELAENSHLTERAVSSNQPLLQVADIQTVESIVSVEQIQSKESIILNIQATEKIEDVKQITEPAENLALTQRAVISNQPILQVAHNQPMESIVPAEQIQSKESIIPTIQATETTEPIKQKEKREVLISQSAAFEACDKETKVEEPIKHAEEENDDVWLDAEEDIHTQEETVASLLKVDEPTDTQSESGQEEKEPEHEFEMAPDSKAEDGESHQRVHKTGGTCEIESEGEDFAVALEYPETATGVTPAEWD